MSTEEIEKKLDDFIELYKNNREQDKKSDFQDRHRNYAAIAMGFAAALASFSIAHISIITTISYAIFAILFVSIGCYELGKANKGFDA